MITELKNNLKQIYNETQEKLIPENIKKDVQILGVTGTYEGSGGGTTEGVKLFETQEAMQADPDAKEGDLAVVYRSEIQNIKDGDTITSMIFPRTVIFEEAITSSYNARLMGNSIDCDIGLSSTQFYFYDMFGTIPEITYSSSDGITYTRTDSNEDTYEIEETTIEGIDEHICRFIQTGGKTFEGLYKCNHTNSTRYNYLCKNINITDSSVTCEYTELIDTQRILKLLYDTYGSNSGLLKQVDSSNYIVWSLYLIDSQYNEAWSTPILRNNGDGTLGVGVTRSDFYIKKFIINLDENTCIKEPLPEPQKINSSTYIYDNININDIILPFRNYINQNISISYNSDYKYLTTKDNMVYEYQLAPTQLSATKPYVYSKNFYGKNGAEQGTLHNLNCITKDEVSLKVNVWNTLKDGIICPEFMSGAFKNTNLTEIPLLDTSKVTNMDHMLAYCSNLTTIPLLDTSNVTNMNAMFSEDINLASIPLLDTSNVIHMNNTFEGCKNLTEIPLLNTSKVTDMYSAFNRCIGLTTLPLFDLSSLISMNYTFEGCKNLTAIPSWNTSNLKSMVHAFYMCSSLNNIPLLDTSKVTNISDAFYKCTSLTEIPQFNTSNVTNIARMVAYCTNLVTVPQLNIPKATEMTLIFKDCPNLSEESLNNILATCTTATSYTNTKTLKYIGLTSEQATKCTTLSNYQAFLDAGWTTGY